MVEGEESHLKSIRDSFIKGLASGLGVFVLSTVLSLIKVINLSTEDILFISIITLFCVYFLYISFSNFKIEKDNELLRKKVDQFENDSVWAFMPVEVSELELNSNNPELVVIRQWVRKSDLIKACFKSEQPVDFSIKQIRIRYKYLLPYSNYGQLNFDSSKSLQGSLEAADTIDSKFRNVKWEKEIDVTELSDIFFIAKLPEDLPRTSVKIIIYVLKKTNKKVQA